MLALLAALHGGCAIAASTTDVTSDAAAAAPADASTAPTAPTMPAVVVTATRSAQSSFDVPASIDAVSLADPTNTPGINAAEYLGSIPGLVARDRQNYAQDEQISIRGFGARSTFGVRGVRLYTDGIPATMPDGQGQVSNFGLGSADRIEVLRGPFSALYGNSSGGVIQIFTADGTQPTEVHADFDVGGYGTYRIGVGARGSNSLLDYNLDLSQFSTDGYRGHGSAERENANAKINIHLDGDRKLTLIANTIALPNADDPLGLTRAQFDADPRQAQAVALQFDTRKTVHQDQVGAIYEQGLGNDQTLRLMSYYGDRNVEQYQSIPVSTELKPTSPGGVIDLDGVYGGVDARWTWHGALANRPLDLTVGTSFDRQDVHRYGYNNFVGDVLGIQGALRRDEQDDEYNFDQYIQANWNFSDRFALDVGVRHSDVRFSADDNFINATSPDDSGHLTYSATSPVAGLLFRASEHWHLYASYGNGFETPTFTELGYRPDGSAGINFNLVPARSHNSELGSKLLFGTGGEFDVALFQADTRHELAVDTSTGGRTTYQNIDRAQRRGVEAKIDYPIAPDWHAQLAYTYLDATFRAPFLTCPAASTCTTPNTLVEPGARLPGVPRSDFYAALRYGERVGWNATLDTSAAGNVAVNDQNTQFAPGFALLNASLGYGFDIADAKISTYVRLNNIFDRTYIGSVIVNESNGRYYEPGPGRTLFAGVDIRWR